MRNFIMAVAATMVAVGCTETEKENADQLALYNEVVETLSGEQFCGRSDFGEGGINAGKYIVDKLMEFGIAAAPDCTETKRDAFPHLKSAVHPYGIGRWEGASQEHLAYLQNFCHPLNVMRGRMELSVDGVVYQPAVDFTAKEFSPSCEGTFGVVYADSSVYDSKLFVEKLNGGQYKDKFVVIDWDKYQSSLEYEPFDRYLPYMMPLDNVGGLILKGGDNLFPYFKARAHYLTPLPVLMVRNTFPEDASSVAVAIDSQMIQEHDGHNIVALIEGAERPDERITFIAHYDHLGMMGKDNVIPGANDNASGVAMLLMLAKHYQTHRPAFSMEFIFLDSEESNLLGAFYYTENPRMPLEDIKLLVNLDMVGDNGILACQASDEGQKYLDEFKSLIIASGAPFAEGISQEELNDGSDHFAFALKNVPALYFSFEGDYYKHYHSPRDIYQNTTDEYVIPFYTLLTDYIDGLK